MKVSALKTVTSESGVKNSTERTAFYDKRRSGARVMTRSSSLRITHLSRNTGGRLGAKKYSKLGVRNTGGFGAKKYSKLGARNTGGFWSEEILQA